MGIFSGNVTKLLQAFQRGGIYNTQPRSYAVYVDGEFVRYKGMTSENLSMSQPELMIADTAFIYLNNVLSRLYEHLHKHADAVYVYMDGERVHNKTMARRVPREDVGLIRSSFVALCRDMGYRVVQLERGESELQMYLQRERSYELNVFLTSDSDMLSICYNHMPTVSLTAPNGDLRTYTLSAALWSDLHDREEEEEEIIEACRDIVVRCGEAVKPFLEERAALETRRVVADSVVSGNRYGGSGLRGLGALISDNNVTYVNGIVQDVLWERSSEVRGCKVNTILDSCVWFRTNVSDITVIAMDMQRALIGYDEHIFRTFVALNGTDFSNNLLPNSMIGGFLHASDDCKRFMNSYFRLDEVFAVRPSLVNDAMFSFDRTQDWDNEDGNSYESIVNDYLARRELLWWNKLSAAVLLVCMKYSSGYTMKRADRRSEDNFDAYKMAHMLKHYHSYITTGRMTSECIEKTNMYQATVRYLSLALDIPEKSSYRLAKNVLQDTSLPDAMSNFDRNFRALDEYRMIEESSDDERRQPGRKSRAKRLVDNDDDYEDDEKEASTSTATMINVGRREKKIQKKVEDAGKEGNDASDCVRAAIATSTEAIANVTEKAIKSVTIVDDSGGGDSSSSPSLASFCPPISVSSFCETVCDDDESEIAVAIKRAISTAKRRQQQQRRMKKQRVKMEQGIGKLASVSTTVAVQNNGGGSDGNSSGSSGSYDYFHNADDLEGSSDDDNDVDFTTITAKQNNNSDHRDRNANNLAEAKNNNQDKQRQSVTTNGGSEQQHRNKNNEMNIYYKKRSSDYSSCSDDEDYVQF